MASVAGQSAFVAHNANREVPGHDRLSEHCCVQSDETETDVTWHVPPVPAEPVVTYVSQQYSAGGQSEPFVHAKTFVH